jgi:hypothetical protein
VTVTHAPPSPPPGVAADAQRLLYDPSLRPGTARIVIMNTVTLTRKRAIKPHQSALSKADQELAKIKAAAADVLSSKEKSAAFLQQVGIIDKRGRLTKPYRAA